MSSPTTHRRALPGTTTGRRGRRWRRGTWSRRRSALLAVTALVSSLAVTVVSPAVSSADPAPVQPAAWSTTVSMDAAVVSSVAGSGAAGTTDGTGSAASFQSTQGMAIVGGYGYVIDSGYVRRVTLSSGLVSTVAGDGTSTCHDSTNPATAGIGVALNLVSDGNYLYWPDFTCNTYGGGSRGFLRRMSLATGAVSVLPGPVIAGQVTIGPAGQLFISAGTGVFSVDPATGDTTLLATLPTVHYINTDTQDIVGLAADSGYIYTSSNLNDCDCTYSNYSTVNKIDASTGTVTMLYQQPYQTNSAANGQIVSAGSYLYIACNCQETQVLRLSKSPGAYTSVAGSSSGFRDGVGSQAWFSGLTGIDTDGTDLWVDDAGNHRIRKLAVGSPLPANQPAAWTTTVGIGAASVASVAGSGASGTTDGTGSAASFATPAGMAVVGGYGYVIDGGYVRRVALASGLVSTVAGDGTGACHDSANPATAGIGITTRDLASDGTYLYWVDFTCNIFGGGHGYLRRMSLATGAVSLLPGRVSAQHLTIGSAGQLFMSAGTQVFSVDQGTGDTTLLATLPTVHYINTDTQDIVGLAADSGYIYTTSSIYDCDCTYSNYSTVNKIDASTGTVTMLYQQPLQTDHTAAGPIVSAGAYLYIACSCLRVQVLRLPKSGGSYTSVAGDAVGYQDGIGSQARFSGLTGIDTDGTSLWVDDAGNHRIRKLGVALPISALLTELTATYPSAGLGPDESPGAGNTAENCDCGQGQATGHPINTATGAFWHTFTDLALPGRGPGLQVTRTYVSTRAGHDSLFGYGWSSNYDIHLTADSSNGDVTVHQSDGSQVAFVPSGYGTFTPIQPRIMATLSEDSHGVYTFVLRRRTTFQFNAGGQLTSISDLNGNSTTLGYDSAAQLSSATDSAGRSYTFTTVGGHVTLVTDPAGHTVGYGYSPAGDLTSVTDPTSAKWTFTYDTNHRLLSMLNPDQQTATTPVPLTNVYDSNGRVTSQTDFAGRQSVLDYTSIAGAIKVTDPAGNITVDYYTDGLRTKSTVGYGTSSAASTNYTYDPVTESVASVIDPLSHTTSYTYDTAGDLLTTTDPLSRNTTSTYDALGDQLTRTDAMGVETTKTFDANGNLLTSSTPVTSATGTPIGTSTTTYQHTDSSHPGDVTGVVSPNGNTVHDNFDTYGDLVSVSAPPTPENAAGNKTTYGYDTTTGWRTSMVSPKGNITGGVAANYTTTYTYDNDGRLTRTRDPLWSSAAPTLHQTTIGYDPDGNTVTSTDGNDHTTGYAYDADDELITTTRPDTTTTHQTWTADGMLHTRADAAGHTVTNGYDSRNNLTSSQDALGHITSFSYDYKGNLTLRAAPGASCTGTPTSGCTTFGYDADDELTARNYLDGVTHDVTGISYDADGRRTGMTDVTGTSSWAYDSLGRLSSSTDGHGVTTSYGHDLDGNVTSISYPGSGHTVTRTFDALDRLASVSDWNGNTTTTGYDQNSEPVSTNFPSSTGETDTTSYDAAGQISTITDSGHNGRTVVTLAGFSYTRDGAGQLATATTTGISEPAQAYSYSSLEQLTAAGSASTPTGFGYDAGDNITNRGTTSGGTASTLAYDADNQLCWSSPNTETSPTCGTVPAGAIAYTYDSNGNRTQASLSRSISSYTYDEAQQLSSVTNPSGTSTNYSYDGDGLRQSKTTGSTTTHFTWDQSAGLPMVLSDDTNYYVYGAGGLPLEQISTATGAVYWLHHDQLGSTRLVTNGGAISASYTYDAYGYQTAHTGSVTTPLGYDGQYTDTETGFVYLRARYYDPATAQFLSVDPLLQETHQAYAYVNGNPLNAQDPSGLIGNAEDPDDAPDGMSSDDLILDLEMQQEQAGDVAHGEGPGEDEQPCPIQAAQQADDHIVLGIEDEGLGATAAKVGGRTLMNDKNWRITLQKAIADPLTRFTVSLDGFSGSSTMSQVLGAVSRGATPIGKLTEQEMTMLYEGARLPDVTFVRGGQVVSNPFAS